MTEKQKPESIDEGETRKVEAVNVAKTERIDTTEALAEELPAELNQKAGSEEAKAAEEEPFLVDDGGTPETEAVKEAVIAALKTVFDPEIPVNIYELGMIYGVKADQDHRVLVTMTLTSPSCPVAGSLPGEVEQKVKDTEDVSDAKVDLVWDPPWTPDMMSDAAKLQLNMM